MNRRCMLTTVLGLMVLAFAVDAASAYYNPRAGRFLNRDPIAEDGGKHLYAFVKNDPINAIDPLGLKKCSQPRGSLQLLLRQMATRYSRFTRSGRPDPKGRMSWQLLSCIACQESTYNPCAKGDNDYGLMQLRKTGALAQCQKWGMFPKNIDFSDEQRKKCCDWKKQPRFRITAVGGGRRVYVFTSKERKCAKGCEESIWNIEKQAECAARYLQSLRDGPKGTVTLAMMICRYNLGPGHVQCKDDKSSRKWHYTKSVLECLGELEKVNPDDPDPKIAHPPDESE